MSMTALSPKLRPLIQQAVKSQGARTMTVLSKLSGEEYKKLVSLVKLKWVPGCMLNVPQCLSLVLIVELHYSHEKNGPSC
jgi:hypothetical protein